MIRNETRQTVVAERARFADTFMWRLRGMIWRRFDAFDGLLFDRCGSIHMFFMRMPLDVIFADRGLRIRGVRRNLKPWRMAFERGGYFVVELPVGTIDRTGCLIGDQLRLEPPLALDVPVPRQ